MLSKKSFGIAGAAMLGTVALLGANAANAAINLDADDRTATFAQETVTSATDDAMMYYMVTDTANGTDTNALQIQAEIGLGGAQDESMTVTFDLTGMQFGADMTSASLTLDTDAVGGADKTGTAGEKVLQSGGQEGDTQAVFRLSNGDGTIEQGDVLVLDIDTLGVMASGGTINITVRHEDTSLGTVSPDNMGVVNFASGIKYNNGGMNAMTYVADGYVNFGPEDGAMPDATPPAPAVLQAHVGSFSISTVNLNAASGAAATLTDIFGAAALTADAAGRMAGSITFDEDMFGFAEEAWLEDTSGNAPAGSCSVDAATAATAFQVWDADAADDDDKFMVAGLGDLGTDTTNATTMTGTRHLCFLVDGETSIPGTENYTAVTSFEGIDDAKMPPMDGEVMLGRIVRDGITVQLPYLTTSMKYNQRLVIVNRNRNAVSYSIDFSSEEGTMATAKMSEDDMEVEGTCVGMYEECEDPPHGLTTVIKVEDLVDITGTRGRTSGTLMLESVPGMVDVATTQVNLSNGGTDTVVYEPEM